MSARERRPEYTAVHQDEPRPPPWPLLVPSRLSSRRGRLTTPLLTLSLSPGAGADGYPCSRCYDLNLACVPQKPKQLEAFPEASLSFSTMDLLYRSCDPMVRRTGAGGSGCFGGGGSV